jgi:hypothetical protein
MQTLRTPGGKPSEVEAQLIASGELLEEDCLDHPGAVKQP